MLSPAKIPAEVVVPLVLVVVLTAVLLAISEKMPLTPSTRFEASLVIAASSRATCEGHGGAGYFFGGDGYARQEVREGVGG